FGFRRLQDAFREARGSAALLRNAGLLIAELCQALPAVPGVPAWADVYVALKLRQTHGEHLRPGLVQEPPLPRSEFERQIAARLEGLDAAALLHWLRHGRGPVPGAEKLAEPVESLPVRVARLLADARRRPR